MHPQQPYNIRRQDDDWQLYPEPPTALSTMQSTVGMASPQQQQHPNQLPTPPAVTYGGYPSTLPQELLSAVSPTGFEPVWNEQQVYFGHSSPSQPAASDDAELQVPPSNLSSASGPSASSSAAGSPQSFHGQLAMGNWQDSQPGFSVVGQDFFTGTEYASQPQYPGLEEFQGFDVAINNKAVPYGDPTVIHPDMRIPVTTAGFEPFTQPAYPSPTMSSSPQPPQYANGFPQFHGGPFQPPVDHRRHSVISSFSVVSHDPPSHSGDESGKEKQRCPHPDCGKTFKDLKAHMLTHQNERPEKCPITTCDYHVKGFARKYDKNRHTLTHYKGTMVCGFCPGSGSAAEKSFNRADVFKRHLTAVHGVEQTPPNSRKKTSGGVNSGKKLTGYAPDATGKCSTCSSTFSNAQDFYEHLDDCVLRIVQQEDPAEAINAQHLAGVENDKAVVDTLEKNHLPTTTPSNAPTIGDDEDDDEMGEEDEEPRTNSSSSKSPVRKTVKTGPANGIQKSKGLTHSRGGVSLPTKGRARKNRRDYPSSWGFDKGQMTMKKRVVAVFDGPRRLAKDDMMLSTEHEVRVPLSDGKSYVTDLDVQTMKRAVGFHQATEEEKGPWISDDPTEEQRQTMLMLQQQQRE